MTKLWTVFLLVLGIQVLCLRCPLQVIFHLKGLLQKLPFSTEHPSKRLAGKVFHISSSDALKKKMLTRKFLKHWKSTYANPSSRLKSIKAAIKNYTAILRQIRDPQNERQSITKMYFARPLYSQNFPEATLYNTEIDNIWIVGDSQIHSKYRPLHWSQHKTKNNIQGSQRAACLVSHAQKLIARLIIWTLPCNSSPSEHNKTKCYKYPTDPKS